MSYCVNIRTAKRPAPDDIFQEFANRGERIIITSNEFPCLRFGTLDEALRGIEINEMEDGLEVRVCSCSSIADYHLFVVAIDVLKTITSAPAYSEDDIEIKNPSKQFDVQWINSQITSSWDIVCLLSKESGHAIVMDGMFLPFCVGPQLLKSMGVNLYNHDKNRMPGIEKLTNYLVKIQWWLSDASGTQSRLAINDKDNPEAPPLEISLITIENNEVRPFDYISFAPVLAISNLDTEEVVMIRFEDFKKIYGVGDHLSCIDEWQMKTCGGMPTVEEITEMMSLAKRYAPDNLHYRPAYPGSGYDERQKTFVLMWNPETSDISVEEYIQDIQNVLAEEIFRSIHEWKDAQMGDRFYVIKVGNGSTGVVMSGVFGSHPFVQNGKNGGRSKHFIELKPNMMLNPNTVPMLTISDLEHTVPDFMWRGGYSGRLLTEKQAAALESRYSQYLNGIRSMNDGINLYLIRKF